MTICLEKSCSFGLQCVLSIYAIYLVPFRFDGDVSIRLYWFLIIAYFFNFLVTFNLLSRRPNSSRNRG